MVKDKLCKKYLYLAGLCLLLFVGCGKKDNNTSSDVKKSSDGEYETEVVNNTSFINRDFLNAEVIDGKQLYLFVNMSGKDGIFKRDLKVSYYEYKNNKFKLYKNIICDDSVNMMRYALSDYVYNKNNNMFVALVDSAGKKDEYPKYSVNVYDLNDGSRKRIFLDDYDMQYGNLQMADDNTVAVMRENMVLLYDIETEDVKKVNILDYPTSLTENDCFALGIQPVNKNGNYLDMCVFGSKYTIVRIDLEKNEMIFEKKLDCDGIQYIDNYVMLQDPPYEKFNVIDKATLDNNFEVKGCMISYLEDSTVSLLRRNAQIFKNIENDEIYSVSDETLLKTNLKSQSTEEVEWAKGMGVTALYKLDNVMYALAKDGIYKVDLNSNEKEKIADLDEGVHSGYLKMCSDDIGYVREFNYGDEYLEGETYTWIKKK